MSGEWDRDAGDHDVIQEEEEEKEEKEEEVALEE